MEMKYSGSCERCKMPFVNSEKAFNGLYHFNSLIVEGLDVCVNCNKVLKQMINETKEKWKYYGDE